jgi:hypothetical protein
VQRQWQIGKSGIFDETFPGSREIRKELGVPLIELLFIKMDTSWSFHGVVKPVLASASTWSSCDRRHSLDGSDTLPTSSVQDLMTYPVFGGGNFGVRVCGALVKV